MNIIITRHKILVEWFSKNGITGKVIEQATIEDVKNNDVYGILPLWLASEAKTITEVSMPKITLEQRKRNISGNMSIEEMDKAGAHLVTYIVNKL